MRATSAFSYTISRPYPYRFFTPAVIIGGAILLVLFSLVNLAANGYYMRTVYTNDPNTTVREGEKWFMKAPFNWADRLRPVCEPRLLSVGDQLFTTNYGFTWEVTAITQSSDAAQGFTSLASIPYLNNTLEDCRLDVVHISLIKGDIAPPPGWWISWTPSSCTTSAYCTINSESGPVNVAVRTQYQTGGDSNHDYVIEDNYTTHASVWWGTRLLNAYWIGLESVLSQVAYGDGSTFYMRGGFDYHWNESDKKSIRELDFFSLVYFLLGSDAGIDNTDFDTSEKLIGLYSLSDVYPFSYPILEGMHFAKIMYSLLAIDLGNTKIPNLLTSVDDLKYIIEAPDDYNRQPGGVLYDNPTMPGFGLTSMIPYPGGPELEDRVLVNETYAQFSPQMGSLGTKAATFYSQYTCSLPVQKSTGTMLIAILIADLVFLQAAWKILTWTTDGILVRKDPTAMFCQGCMKGDYKAVSLQPLTPITSQTIKRRPVSRHSESSQELLYSDGKRGVPHVWIEENGHC